MNSADPHQVLRPGDRSAVRHLALLAKQVVEGAATGLHRSPHKGLSVEFKQHRQYVPGDELRRLDWKVYGKSDRFFIREYEEETNLRATLMVDASGSMAYQGDEAELSKYAYAVRLAACISYLLLHQQDSVGLATFDRDVRDYLPPKGRPRYLTNILDVLTRTEPGEETDLADAFRNAAPRLKQRGLLIILSDCFGDVEKLLRSIALLRSRHHEVLILQVFDRDELAFPFHDRARFDSLETEIHHLVDPRHIRNAYLETLSAWRKNLETGCRRHKVDLMPVVTDQAPGEMLGHFIARRNRGKTR